MQQPHETVMFHRRSPFLGIVAFEKLMRRSRRTCVDRPCAKLQYFIFNRYCMANNTKGYVGRVSDMLHFSSKHNVAGHEGLEYGGISIDAPQRISRDAFSPGPALQNLEPTEKRSRR
eukprot:jgi/Botrbrau1/3455/Bobra.139_1s0032.2